MRARILPNRTSAPLSRDEREAEQYIDRPGRALELAELTGNRGLYGVARALMKREPRKRRG